MARCARIVAAVLASGLIVATATAQTAEREPAAQVGAMTAITKDQATAPLDGEILQRVDRDPSKAAQPAGDDGPAFLRLIADLNALNARRAAAARVTPLASPAPAGNPPQRQASPSQPQPTPGAPTVTPVVQQPRQPVPIHQLLNNQPSADSALAPVPRPTSPDVARGAMPLSPSQPTANAVSPGQVESPASANPAASSATPAPSPAATLLAQLRSNASPNLRTSVNAILLALIDPSIRLQASDFDKLTPTERDRLYHFGKSVAALTSHANGSSPAIDRDQLDADLESFLGHAPLKLTAAKLCRRVRGFGVYEPFEKNVFLAGHEQPAVVYTELDSFRAEQNNAGLHEVRLQQDVKLVSVADGLVVWKQPSVEIVDVSQNRRRDFFVVQLIRLPDRLTVGRYSLHIRVEDQATGDTAETALPISIVADSNLAAREEAAGE